MAHPLSTFLTDQLDQETGLYSEAALRDIEAAFRRSASDREAVDAGFLTIALLGEAGFAGAKAQLDQLVLKLLAEGTRGGGPSVERLGADFRRFSGTPRVVDAAPAPKADPTLKLSARPLRC